MTQQEREYYLAKFEEFFTSAIGDPVLLRNRGEEWIMDYAAEKAKKAFIAYYRTEPTEETEEEALARITHEGRGWRM